MPYLFVAALEESLAPAVAVDGLKTQGMLLDVTVKELKAGHRLILEIPEENGDAVVIGLKERF